MDYADALSRDEYIARIMEAGEIDDFNTVTKPKHYMLFDKTDLDLFVKYGQGIEVRDVIERLVNKMYVSYQTPKSIPMAMADYVQLMQYLMRFMDKNGKEDLEKARWYLDKLIQAY